MIGQILECLIAGIGIGIRTFLSVLPFYKQLSGLNEQPIAWYLGVPVAIISFICIAIKVGKKYLSRQ